MKSLNQHEVLQEFIIRIDAGQEPLEAASAILFDRLNDAELTEYIRLLREIREQDGRDGWSPQMLYDLAVTAVFNVEDT